MVVALIYLIEIKSNAVSEFDLPAKGEKSHLIKF